jgi:hypothetical protein
MASFEEVCARVDWLRANKVCRPDEKCSFVLVEREVKKRVANDGPKQKTRLIKELHTPQAYSEFNATFDRYVALAGDPNVAFSIMLRLLAQLSDDSIRALARDDHAS